MKHENKWANIKEEDPKFYENILEEINKDAKIYAEEVVRIRRLLDLEEMEALEDLKKMWKLENQYEEDILELLEPESIEELDYLFENDFDDEFDSFIFEREEMGEFFDEIDYYEEHIREMEYEELRYKWSCIDKYYADKEKQKEDSIDGVESCFERGYNLSDEEFGWFHEEIDDYHIDRNKNPDYTSYL